MSPAETYLALGALLFCVGTFMVFSRRNAIMALIGIELILNGANLNFVAFGSRQPAQPDGQMAAIFVMVLAAAEVAVALAIVLNVYKRFRTADIDEIDTLKE